MNLFPLSDTEAFCWYSTVSFPWNTRVMGLFGKVLLLWRGTGWKPGTTGKRGAAGGPAARNVKSVEMVARVAETRVECAAPGGVR